MMGISVTQGKADAKAARLRPQVRAYLSSYNTLRAAEKACEQAFRSAYPRGADIEWMHGEYLQHGEVVLHGYGLRVKALNRRTGREVWLDAGRIHI